jgi:hypothetical protein
MKKPRLSSAFFVDSSAFVIDKKRMSFLFSFLLIFSSLFAAKAAVPETVKKELSKHDCSIPQTTSNSSQNIIQGDFAGKNSQDWAVLCSKNGRSSIVVVWGKERPCPSELEIREDNSGLARHISATTFPTKKQQGIEDTEAAKDSVIFYCENGKWLSFDDAD